MQPKQTCPECHLNFEAEVPETGVLACPLCNTVFSTLPPSRSVPTAPSPLASASSGRQVLRGVLAVGTVLLLVGGAGYAYHLLDGIGHKAAPVEAPTASAPHPSESPSPVDILPIVPALRQQFNDVVTKITQGEPQFQLPPQVPLLKPPDFPKEALQPRTLPERINRAIERGLAYVRVPQQLIRNPRCFGLLGLTLLECGVSTDDASVRQLAAAIRAREHVLYQTYELTLAILFLDRLGDPSDRTFIRTCGQRLVSGQHDCGAWSYSSPIPDWQRVAARRLKGNGTARRWNYYSGDNSNTQFAILGLWVAQRYGVQAHPALLAAERYFRATQATDGSWSYHPNGPLSRDSMTCAGLMSLAMRYGVIAGQGGDIRPDHPISVQDPAIHRGLRFLAQSLEKITVVGNGITGAEARDAFYLLWSLERMAVIYDLKKIGDREWYPWAAEMLVETQWTDGRWLGANDPVPTCFALLVLKRSNFAKDLQLAVQEPPSPAMSDVSGPIILQGPDAFLGQSRKPQGPVQPLGPSITRTPQTK
jgi:hypothetical protein